MVPRKLPLLFSVAAHVTATMLLVGLPESGLSTQAGRMQAGATGDDTGRTRIVHLYLPPRGTAVQKRTVSLKSAGPRGTDHETAAPNLTGIRLSIQDDHDFQLLRVLRRYKGFFGVARVDQNNVITRLFRANDFQRVPVNAPHSRDDYFAVRIIEPSTWPLGAELAKAARADELVVFALFPRSFVNRLDRAIRRAAASTESAEFNVTEAVICFSDVAPDGFRIQHVNVVPSPAEKKVSPQASARSQEEHYEATR